MRVLLTVALILLILEALLALACCAGYYWLGGGLRGTLLVVAVVLLIVAPWLGELRAEFDSETGAGSARLGWWGAVRFQQEPAELRGRVLGIPFRLRSAWGGLSSESSIRRPPSPAAGRRARARKPAPRGGRRGWALAQAVPAALQLLLDLLREAREVSVQVRAPSQNVYVDAILAATVGTRAWGPVELTTLGSGKRWIAVRYRSGLLRALLTVLYAAIQGRASRIIRG